MNCPMWTVLDILPARTMEDLSAIESAVALHLGGEQGRCPRLRSQAYQKLRLAALYFADHPGNMSVHHRGLRVSLENGRVVIAREEIGEVVESLEEVDWKQSKRQRLLEEKN